MLDVQKVHWSTVWIAGIFYVNIWRNLRNKEVREQSLDCMWDILREYLVKFQKNIRNAQAQSG